MISPFAFAISKLNGIVGKQIMPLESDKTYLRHVTAESEERKTFLDESVPAFFYSLTSELVRQIDIVNAELIHSVDRLQVHFNQKTMTDLLVTSNVERSKWFNEETSIEIATNNDDGEILAVYRRPRGVRSSSEDFRLHYLRDRTLGISSRTKTFSIEAFASYLIDDFLRERQLVREPPEED